MTAIFTADWHLSDNPRDEYRWALFPWLRELIAKNKEINLLIIGGDLTEEKDRHPATLVNRLATNMHLLARQVPVIIYKGNHDFLLYADTPFFGWMGRIPNVTYITSPTMGETLPIEPLLELGKVLFLPFDHNPEKHWPRIRGMELCNWIFCHQAFAGAEGIPGGTDPALLPKGPVIVAGDIHKRQIIDRRIMYVGSPYSVDFGDTPYYGVMVLGPKKGFTYAPYKGPQKHLVEQPSLESLLCGAPPKFSIVKVRIPPHPKKSWREVKDEVHKWADENKLVVWSISPIGQAVKSRKLPGEKAVKSDEELITAYGKKRGLDPKVIKSGIWLSKNV